jgi:hypothetical protein
MSPEQPPRSTEFQTAVNGTGSETVFRDINRPPKTKWYKESQVTQTHLFVLFFATCVVVFAGFLILHEEFVRYTAAQEIQQRWAQNQMQHIDHDNQMNAERLQEVNGDYKAVRGWAEGKAGQPVTLTAKQ